MIQNNAIGIDYSDQRLRVLVEEYITQQRGTVTLATLCLSYFKVMHLN